MKRILTVMAVVVAVGAVSGCCLKQKRNAASMVRLEGDQITVGETIQFETGKSTISAASHDLLDAVANILKSDAGIKKTTIEGHTDSSGDAGFNKQLSQDRADAVKAYLVGKGVAAERLDAVGFGAEKPIAPNDTEEGRATNRRVAFKVAR